MMSDTIKIASHDAMTALLEVERKAPLPDYVLKQASVDESDLAVSAFADLESRLLPIYDASSTYKSAAVYFGNVDALNPGVVARIKAASVIHGIAEDVAGIEAMFAESKKASADLSAMEEGEGRSYSLRDGHDVLDADRQLMNDFYSETSLPMRELTKRATELRSACDRLDITRIPAMAARFGEVRDPDFEKAAALIRYRSTELSVDPAQAEIYDDLCKAAAAEPDQLPGFLDLMCEMDKAAGIKYSRYVLTPHEMFFTGMTERQLHKLASATVLVEQCMIPIDVFDALPDTALEKTFCKASADTLKGLRTKASFEITSGVAGLSDSERKRLLGVLLDVAA